MQTDVNKSDISILNWMGTLILSSIPGINIILWVIWGVTSKKRSKRNFAWASLILTILCAVLIALAFVFYGPEIVDWVVGLANQPVVSTPAT